MELLKKNIQFIKGVGEKKARLFNKLGIFTVDDLIRFYPRSYENWNHTVTVKNAPADQLCYIKATMITPVREHMVRKCMTLYKCDFSDGEALIHVTIFNNKYLAKGLRTDQDYILCGKVEKTLTHAYMSAPKIEKAEAISSFLPVYPATEKLNSAAIRRVMKTALESADVFEETLSKQIRETYHLIPLDRAIRQIHFPADQAALEQARERLVFEELLILQLGLIKLKSAKKQKTGLVIQHDFSNGFSSLLPFTLTKAQARAVSECVADLKTPYPMNRLIQGDVGSGKTAVAASIVYTVIKNGYQCAFMAPTEILAGQHYKTITQLLKNTGICCELLTGSVKQQQKREIKQELMNGRIDLIIGTHALIQNDVVFNNLGLVITDEQHRFGVQQRAQLAQKGTQVNTLVMSATPIPRTMGLMIYGDLDISILDELPPGRQEIRTDVVDSRYHKRIYQFIRDAADRGEQCYIICPLVEESESESGTNLKSAGEYAEYLSQTHFRGYNLGLLHGKMKPGDKERVMQSFTDGDIQILVATTVVEVGVDVPNATIMVIENAERFGLSQLHQLRGRIGRGKAKSFCILVSDAQGDNAKNRLNILKTYSDGFMIADEDLKARGPGDFFGNRQHGLPDLKIADMLEDLDTLKKCRICAENILKTDCELNAPEHRPLCRAITKMFDKSKY